MVQNLLGGRYRGAELYHVRLGFSRDMREVGTFRVSKLLHLVLVIARIVDQRLRHGIDVLYYCPAGPDRIPVYRDLVILTCTRWLFRRVIFHFHASGVSDLYEELPAPLRLLFRAAYFAPDASIRLSDRNPEDGRKLGSKREYLIPNGIQDCFGGNDGTARSRNDAARILFVGVLRRTKGILVLVEACRLLRDRGLDFAVDVAGEFASEEFEARVRGTIASCGLADRFRFMGVLQGKEKHEAYVRANLFCYPSFFESESLPLVVLEAMQFALPVVSTRWRGIPSIVEEGRTGFLVPVQDGEALAEKLAFLIENPRVAEAMGRRGREAYLRRFTFERFQAEMEKVFAEVGAPPGTEEAGGIA